ncbi:MAG: aminotransferase class I/II-fold pyridoxal phosphate-dependent enzyme [Syntrophorhabdales bacterium]|jgi:aspartate/methionine/tyrosine aminotransferase
MEKPKSVLCTPRSAKIQPFYVMELLEKAQALEARGEDVVHMEIGEPDFKTPRSISDSGVRALEEGHTFYTHSLGLPALRERIAAYYAESYGITVSADRIIVTNGTSGAFFLLCSVLLDGTRNLVISDPGYPCYRNFGTLFDACVVSLPASGASRFEITAGQIEKCGAVPHLVMVCSPSNPTGLVYGKQSLARLHDAVSRAGGVLAVDEIYSGLTYGRKFPSSLDVSDEIVVIDGFSKTYAMTGWRLGWMVAPESLVRPIQKVAQNVFISAPTIAQYAALDAFDAARELETMKKTYEERRAFLFPRLKQLGFVLPAWPEGAFYIYADIERWHMDSMEFVEKALLEARVAITPGYDFGAHLAGSHVRFSYATSVERLKEGCERLERWLRGL